MKTLATCFILLLASTPVLAQSNCRLTRDASIDLNFDNAGGVYVPMTISGTTVNLLVDTGGAGSMLTDKAVDSLKLDRIMMDRSTWLVMFGGEVLKYYAQPRDVVLGGLHAPSLRMVIVPVGHQPNFDGTLAPDIMRLYDVDFDFANAKLNLFSQDHCPGAVVYWTKEAYAQIDFHVDRVGHIELPIEVDGHTLNAAFDTGSSQSIMSLELAKRLFDLDEKSPDLKAVPYLRAYRYPFKTLKFGGVTVSNPDILLVPKSVSRIGDKFILGMGILRQLHLYIAYGERKLYVTAASADQHTGPADLAKLDEHSNIPISLHCTNPAVEGQFVADGPAGFLTAKMTFAINSDPVSGTIQVSPGRNAVCTVRAKKGTVISSSTFDIDSGSANAALNRELLRHVQIEEEVAGEQAGADGKAFVFTVKATDSTRGKLVLDFPVRYR